MDHQYSTSSQLAAIKTLETGQNNLKSEVSILERRMDELELKNIDFKLKFAKAKNDVKSDICEGYKLIKKQKKSMNEFNEELIVLKWNVEAAQSSVSKNGSILKRQGDQLNAMEVKLISLMSRLKSSLKSKETPEENVQEEIKKLAGQLEASKISIGEMGSLFKSQAEQMSAVQLELSSLKLAIEMNSTALQPNQSQPPPSTQTSIENVKEEVKVLAAQLEASKSATAQIGSLFGEQAEEMNKMRFELNSLKSELQKTSAQLKIHHKGNKPPTQTCDKIVQVGLGEPKLPEKRNYAQNSGGERIVVVAAKKWKRNELTFPQRRDNGNWNVDSAAKSFQGLELDCGQAFQPGGLHYEEPMDNRSSLNWGLKCWARGCGKYFPDGKSLHEHKWRCHYYN